MMLYTCLTPFSIRVLENQKSELKNSAKQLYSEE